MWIIIPSASLASSEQCPSPTHHVGLPASPPGAGACFTGASDLVVAGKCVEPAKSVDLSLCTSKHYQQSHDGVPGVVTLLLLVLNVGLLSARGLLHLLLFMFLILSPALLWKHY